MPAPTRFTNDEMDDAILRLLDSKGCRAFGLSLDLMRFHLIYDKKPRVSEKQLDYECRQLSRRLQWLNRHDFIYHDRWFGTWFINGADPA